MQRKKANEKEKPRSIDSLSVMAEELMLNESYKSLLLGVGVVLLAAVLVIGYAKNRNTQNMQTTKKVAVVKPGKETEALGTHKVQSGDDLKTISIQYYETPDLFLTIAKENEISNPDIIDEGKELVIPKVNKEIFTPTLTTTSSKERITDTSYTVQEGELLWNIAIRAYGDGHKWKDIMITNNLQSPDAIFSGMILQLPRR